MTEPVSFKCYLMGDQSRLIQCGRLLLEKGHRIDGIISKALPIQSWAKENKLRLVPLGDDIVERLKQQPFDLFFSIDNFNKVPNEILALPRVYAINFHDAPLPRYGGVNATNWAIMNGETLHGITWHIMTDVIDAGDILKQKTFPVSATETAYSLNARCYEESIKCFSEMMDELASGQAKPIRQNLENRSYFPRWKRPFAACTIDWSRSADEIYALFRGLDFRSYWNPLGLPKLYLGDDAVIVTQMNILKSESLAPPGTITKASNSTITVATTSKEVAIGGFSSLSGEPISPSQLLVKFGLHEGSQLPEFETERSEKITRIHRHLCRYEEFWLQRLVNLELIEFPYKKKRILSGDTAQYQEERFLTSMLTMENLENSEKPGDIILAAFLLYLSRIGVKESFDIYFRDHFLFEALMGEDVFFASHVPLRIDVDYENNFKEFFKAIQKQIESLKSHVSYVRDLVLRDPNLRKTFITQLSQRFPVVVERIKQLSGYQPKCDGELIIVFPDDGKECLCLFDKENLDKAAIDCLREQFTVLLQDIALRQEGHIGKLSILPEKESHKLKIELNDTRVEYPRDKCLSELFEAQVEKTPEALVVVYQEKQLTYRELNCRANQLANFLKTLGVGTETLVGLFMDRSLEMIIGIYGILKASGAYVPLDPEYPPDRVAYMIEDTKVPVLLTQEHLKTRLSDHRARVVCIDSDWDTIAKEKTDNLASGTTAENLAYVIYTSGSTGTPKGVMNEHRGICNRLLWMQDEYGLTGSDRILQKTPFSFDVSVWEFFWPLLFGASLIVARPGGHKDSSYLVKLINDQRITTLHFVPSMLKIFLEEEGVENCMSIKRVICSGEALPYELQKRFFERLNTELHNLYGPTEAAVDVTYWRCQPESDLHIVPIGFPVANTQIYILDSQLQPVPLGVTGELHIGGVQVARGYLNRPELTTEKFIPDPFSNELDARLYKTGDLARYLPDGSIDYLGRTDFQVKVRGLRIELGEIENLLAEYKGISQSAVVLREDRPDDKRLVAYLVFKPDHDLNTSELRQYFRTKLPDYMVPQHFVKLDTIPLTPNGKADRRALPKPDMGRISEEPYVAPRNKEEKIIADIWQELLHVNKVGLNDHFFDLGGHSLLLGRMLPKLKELFTEELSIVDLFQYPTIATFCAFLTQKQSAEPSFEKTKDLAHKQIASLKRQKRLASARRKYNG